MTKKTWSGDNSKNVKIFQENKQQNIYTHRQELSLIKIDKEITKNV